jgi:predicted dehydrogenase
MVRSIRPIIQSKYFLMQRRKFFQLASVGAAGLAVGASCTSADKDRGVKATTAVAQKVPSYRENIKTSFSTAGARSPSDRVILALIGAGGYGSRLSMSAARLGENVQIKYICDVDDTRGGWAMSELEQIQGFAPEKVRDMRVVLDDKEVDGVFVATPEHWHGLATIWACQAGKDVYVEKPISHNIFESQQMIKAAMKYERIIQCGTQNRNPDYAFSARDYIKSGKLGEVFAVNVRALDNGPIPFNPGQDTRAPDTIDWDMWLGPARSVPYNVSRNKSWPVYWEYGGGPSTAGCAAHQMDMARLVLDNPGFPKSVYCAGGRYFFDDNRDVPDYQMTTYDYGNFVLTLQSGLVAPYMEKTPQHIRSSDTEFPRWMQNGTRIDIMGTKGMMYVGRMGGGWQVFDKDEKIVAQQAGNDPMDPHILDFIDCIRTRKQPKGDIVEGHRSAVLIHLANISYRAGNKQLIFSPEYETILNDDNAAAMVRRDYRQGYEITENV